MKNSEKEIIKNYYNAWLENDKSAVELLKTTKKTLKKRY